MIDEVEIDLKAARSIRDRRGGEAARCDIQRDVPGMVQPRRPDQTDLADDLGPQMQRRIGLAPRRARQFRPGHLQGGVHRSPLYAVIGISRHDKAGQDIARPQYYRPIHRGWCPTLRLLGILREGGVDLILLDTCLLYTSDAADEEDSVDLGGR